MVTYSSDQIFKACQLIYSTYHYPEFIHPDPIEIPRLFTNQRDQEIAGFFSAMVALGRVDLFMPAVNHVFSLFTKPAEQLSILSYRDIVEILQPTYYRFFTTQSLAGLLFGIVETIKAYGTLEACYLSDRKSAHLHRLAYLRESILSASPVLLPSITIPHPSGVAKRLHLFARWMIRKDQIDLGSWSHGNPKDLCYPVDTHIFHVAKLLTITKRRSPDVIALAEITEFFKTLNPEDPVKFDFSLSRVGLGKGLKIQEYEKTIQKYLE
jgi:uncharacterized protein (TIGR02757 family)